MLNGKKSFAVLFAVVALGAISFGCAPTGDEEKNTAAMKRFYDEVMTKGNLKAIDELIADNYVEHHTPTLDTPTAKARLAQGMAMSRTGFPDLQITVEDIIAKGDKVWAYITMRGTNKGEFMGRPATGKKIEIKGVDIMRFVNGKAVEHGSLYDGLAMMQQLE